MSPQAFYIRNHSSSELHKTDLAALPTISTRPAFATKEAYAVWCHDQTTQHCFYTLAEPEFAGIRPSSQNPIKFLHGIVADYDGDAGAINAALPALTFTTGKAPTWVTTTFSNKARLIWLFEKPVPTFTPDVLTRFLTILMKDFKLKGLLPGLDEGALITNPYTPYELGTNWRHLHGDTRIPHDVVMLALHDASNKAKWKVNGPEIPMEAVAAEVAKRWPGRFAGAITEGARGVRFWDSRADNNTGCTIRKEGVQAWTGECKFIPWAELLGDEFVKQYRANRIGGAIDGTFFDGRDYWQKDETTIWRHLTTEAVKRHINVLHGLSAESKKGQASELNLALTTIDRMQRVDGAFPCLFIESDIVQDKNQRYLNISRAKVMTPSTPSGRAWGDGFPWIAKYLDGLFGDTQREVFLSWFSHFYQNAAKGKPKRGQALFIAGPKSAGKTLLSQCIVGGIMGGFAEATHYLLGETTFNEELFPNPIWAVDDATASADPRMHQKYSQIIKKVVANPYQEYHPKFKKAVTFRWNGRVIVTLNDDPTSIAMLPRIDGSLLDKLIILRAAPPLVSFDGVEDTLAVELPFLADFLSSFVIPEWLKKNPDDTIRFGHDAWHHPALLETAKASSEAAALQELLELWRKYFFRVEDLPAWTGSATDLLGELLGMEGVKGLVSPSFRQTRTLGRLLNHLIAQHLPWISDINRKSSGRGYAISRPAEVTANKKAA
ncbi:MAG: hypothetical protein NTV51_12850 [Verrucomicrobia bacterium]|nr:hypothetical protein [Verrucomicrobiota bacterium]